ncbi:GAF domain-containing sensor histidine kinase [Gloeocapsa sp. PCC 73106]|uniref:GAF domain-containing sensor histidine kinase n=1 Tax=Gloeocapsa sp. PCC 73106 TaxID=102232 RepID=UPI0002AD02EE|nr:GAF domain-containing sensor histidine kinase [Gloeocapsa sp. PCC 73106]ELR97309.1 signal transduction histidine kinase [Gloeocapsa sp. PCC 73106]
MKSQNSHWQQAQAILEILSSLSYQSNNLDSYLHEIACSVSYLIKLDWSVVTLCQNKTERLMASSIDLGEGDQIYSLHGSLTETVVKTGQTLCVENAKNSAEYGCPPEGYLSYLGIPLRMNSGKVIGTICSFCKEPRFFTADEVRIVELFAERAATAIDNYFLYQQQREFNQILEAEVIKQTEALRLAQARIIEQERLAAIGEFASMIVHEIRNPLTTILMVINYFQKIYTTERDQLRANLAVEEAQRLQNLLKEILLYAKPQKLELERFNINQFIETTLLTLEEMPEVQERKLKFIPVIPSVQVLADKDKLKQVLINLVRNAVEAIAPGEIVTCKVEKEPETDLISIGIHNGGIPIPKELLPKITQPFCSGKPGGTGLGLAIVKRIVEAHGGSLSIQSDAKSGTLIKIKHFQIW